MTNRLSHSQANRFMDCSKSWELHYRKRLRSFTTSSALLFGSALGSAVEEYLLRDNRAEAVEVLTNKWQEAEINNVLESLPTSTKLVYSNTDYDKDLLTNDDIENLIAHYGEDVMDKFKDIQKKKGNIGYTYLKKEDKVLYNNVNWFSMYRKGLLMFDAAVKILDENVEEVLGVERKISLKNEDGDEIIGYIDFIVKWKGYDDPLVMDLKTSSIIYEDDSVRTSPQLGLYLHAVTEEFNTRLAGYLVLNKRVRKDRKKVCTVCDYDGSGARHKTCSSEVDGVRCGGAWDEKVSLSINTQVIIDTIPEYFENMVLENIEMVNDSIKTEVYPRNLGACDKVWGPCPYKKLCLTDCTIDEARLVHVPEDDTKKG